MSNYGHIRRSMGPLRWWLWSRKQRRVARRFGYNVGRHGARDVHDPTSLSGKIDQELGDIFQYEYQRGYRVGAAVRSFVTWALFMALCGLVGAVVMGWRG